MILAGLVSGVTFGDEIDSQCIPNDSQCIDRPRDYDSLEVSHNASPVTPVNYWQNCTEGQDALVLISNSSQDRFTVYSDSKSALQALDLYNNSHPIVREIIRWLIYLASRHKNITLCWVPAHVNIRGNEAADAAARRVAASDGGIFNNSIPHRDYFQLIRQAVANHWQSVWSAIDANKLRSIKNCTKPWTSSSQKNRQHEVVLALVVIGHTRLTHGFLMERGHLPYCEDCIVPLSVQHVLAECPSLEEEVFLEYT